MTPNPTPRGVSEYTAEQVSAAFEQWYPGSGVEGCVSEKVSARFGFHAGYKAATLRQPADSGRVGDEVVDRAERVWMATDGTFTERMRAAITAALAAQGQGEVAPENKRLIDSIKAASGYHLRDGTGASDALYTLAIKHGASETEAAGFAHHINGSMNELQGCVYSMATLVRPASPAWVPDDAELLEIARRVGLRGTMHAVSATDARPLLRMFVQHVLAAAPSDSQEANANG